MAAPMTPFDPPAPCAALLAPQQRALARALERLREAGHPLDAQLTGPEAPLWTALLLGSSWALDRLCADARLFAALTAPGVLGAPVQASTLGAAWQPFEAPLPDAPAARLESALGLADSPLGVALRRFRQARMLCILAQDLAGQRRLRETTEALSALADFCLERALEAAEARLQGLWGMPQAPDGGPQRLALLALGKLGERALNLSSDIDLMAVFEAPGTLPGGRTYQAFFVRLVQDLVALLDTRTAEGFVFRVDFRLRPFGESGPLVQHEQATLAYYESQGREWERYALLKARPAAGDRVLGARLCEALGPFVFRRYLDFSAIEALRGMKRLLRQDMRRRGLEADLKLGVGGIREIEFIAQVFQLIHGGRDRRLRTPSLPAVLAQLESSGLLALEDVQTLKEAYALLRALEHRVQGWRDEQTQRLPEPGPQLDTLAWLLGFETAEGLRGTLNELRRRVAQIFDALIADPAPAEATPLSGWQALWANPEGPCPSAAELVTLGAAPATADDLAQALAARLPPWLMALKRRAEQEIGQPVGFERLDALVPRWLAAGLKRPDPLRALERTLPLLMSVLRRSTYLVLLRENPSALSHLLRLAEGSKSLADTLARHPILLDELLDGRTLFEAPTAVRLRRALDDHTQSLPPGDLERALDELRYFKEATLLRIGASELAGVLPTERVSDALTALAELICERTLQLAWDETVARYGAPRDGQGAPVTQCLGVLAYGKLGGFELGWGSDLDLVFLHELPPTAETLGPKVVSNVQFLNRVVQRFMHFLSHRSHSGVLYEIDLRLRPEGASGLLLTTFEAYARYQRESAWTFEHQALVRARPVLGLDPWRRRFAALREEILGRQRDEQALRQDVLTMRERMREAKGGALSPSPAGFALKQDRGGIVDIEFMVQYFVLAWGTAQPALLVWTDVLRTLAAAEASGRLAAESATRLRDSYLAFRAEGHRCALQGQPARTQDPELIAQAKIIASLWQGFAAFGGEFFGPKGPWRE